MKVMVISLYFLFFILFFSFLNFVSAININFDFPEKVYQNNEFNVEIKDVDVSGTLDVKIYLTNKTGAMVSEIYAEKWQSSNYYVKSAYPSQKVFRLIVTDYRGLGQICVKLRQSGKSSAIGEVCRGIEILTKEESLPQKEESLEQVKEEYNVNNTNKSEEVVQANNSVRVGYIDDGPIILENKPVHTTSYFETRMLLIYGFVVLCVLIIILLSLRIL